MRTRIWLHMSRLTIDEQIQHMGFDRGIDNGDLLFIIDDIEHRHFQRRRLRDHGIAGLEIDLQPIALGKGLEPGGERLERITLAGKMQPAAEADPIQPFEEMTQLGFELVE